MHIKGWMFPSKEGGIPFSVARRIKKGLLTLLPKEMLAREDMIVYKQSIFSVEGCGSVSILFLEPGAHIVPHKHIDDAEVYLILGSNKNNSFEYEVCKQGATHELRNTSCKCWALVVSIKFGGKGLV